MKVVKEITSNYTVYVRYAPQLLKFAEKFVSFETAEDITHDVFLRLWDKQVFLLPEEDIIKILFASVRNACIDYLRKMQTEQDALSQQAMQLKLEELDYHSSSEKQFMQQDLLELLMKEVELLPEKTRQVFQMSYAQGLKTAEIAELLNVSVRTIENQLYRSLLFLRKRCKHLLFEFLIIY